MQFILNLTWREIRSSWQRLLFFFLCIAIGVGSVVALRSLIQNLSQAVGTDARALLTADLEVSSTNMFTPDDISRIESVISKSTIIEARNEVITTAAMARPSDKEKEGLQFVELKGIEPPFPLVGDFRLKDGSPFEISLLDNKGAVVAPLLLETLKLNIGDSIHIGESDFVIRATFNEEPGGQSGFRLGPRVFIAKTAFEETGLTRSGSRIRRRILYRTSENPTLLVKELREKLKGTILTVQSYRETQENIGAQFVRTENYLSLTGLLILVLGGVGVWNVARVFVEQKRKTIAVLKCLGADSRKVVLVYLLQILTLGLVGSLFGILLAQLTLWFVGWRFGADLPEKMMYGIASGAAAQGIVLGVLISLLFSLLPLLQIRNIKPSLLLRDQNNVRIRKLDPTKWIFAIFTISGILGIAIWQAGSWKVGTFFLVGLAFTSAILYAVASLLTRSLKGMKKFSTFSVSQAVNSLYRPGNQTRVVLLAVGLGAFVVIAVQSLQLNLVRELDFTRNETLPSLFLVDIQRSQAEAVRKMSETAAGEPLTAIPTVRMRIARVDGAAIDYSEREVRQQQGQIGREFAVTYRPQLEENEKIIAGKWWEPTKSVEPEVSVVDDMARRLKINIGSTITFDVLGHWHLIPRYLDDRHFPQPVWGQSAAQGR
jgi:putative ABC transport system permease protein